MSIPKEVWDIDKRWIMLAGDISLLRNKFMLYCGKGEKGAVDFSKESMYIRGDMMTLIRDSVEYILSYKEEKNVD